ncbi:MAG: hypothetical protein OHK0012_20240 [Synechococcales cyanobacterium]
MAATEDNGIAEALRQRCSLRLDPSGGKDKATGIPAFPRTRCSPDKQEKGD